MTARAAFPVLMLFALAAAPIAAQDAKAPGKDAGTQAAFEHFKQLAGEWVAKGPDTSGPDIHVRYKVTAGGSAVVETIAPGTDHEMVTVIHPDGPDLLLTHYCHLGNQPHMKASCGGDGSKVEFKFVRATNLKSDKDRHMHDATYTFVDGDTFRSEWTLFQGGKAARQVAFEFKRQR
jgi:hypothetical protein